MENKINLTHLAGKNVLRATQQKPAVRSNIAPEQTQTPAPKPSAAPSQFSQNLQSTIMGSSENASYIKEMMKFPKNFNALIYIIQKNLTNAQLQARLHSNILAGRQLSQTQTQILAQLQGLNSAELMQNAQLNQTLLSQLEASIKKLPISSSGMINLVDLATLIKANGKEALTQIIISMANSAKNGINDVSQMKEAAKLINASIAIAGQKDNAQTLKILMLLYLPWLPLQQGVDFELEIAAKDETQSDNSILIIRIQTVNYGEIVAMLVLEDANAVSINIQCSDDFPKDELTLRLNTDNKHYCAQTSLSYTTKHHDKSKAEKSSSSSPACPAPAGQPATTLSNTPLKSFASETLSGKKTQATINMSNTNEINPYLLLTAHLIIRHVVELDRYYEM